MHLIEIQNRATFKCHFLMVVAKTVLSFASAIRPIWWYPDLRTREEKILQLHSHAGKSVILARVI